MFVEPQKGEMQWQLKMLHELLEDTEHVNEATRAELRKVAEEIDRLLSQEAQRDDWSNVGERWRNAVLGFESRHPKLAQAVEEVTGILANAGI